MSTAAIVLVLDLATKSVASASLPSDRSVPVLGDFLRLTLVHNTGAAFGLFPGSGGTFVVFSVAAIGLILILYWRLPAQNFLQLLAMGALLGGALGNLHDRVRSGVVVDFIDVGIGTLRWPVFNFADIAVTAGVGLLLLGVARRPV